MTAAVEFRDLVVATREGRRLVDGVSLALEDGSVTAVLGRSGSGKTTLLRTVNRMVEVTAGEVVVRGEAVRDADVISLRRGIGYVIQETGLFPHYSVERNVGVVLEVMGRPRPERVTRCEELLRAVGLEPAVFAKRLPHQLSGGQRQRVGLARALAAEPEILLMDEPFGALDPLTRAEMHEMLRGLLARLKKTVLLVTHDLDEALVLANRIVLLHEGKVAADLPREDFLRSELPEVTEYVRAFHPGLKNWGLLSKEARA